MTNRIITIAEIYCPDCGEDARSEPISSTCGKSTWKCLECDMIFEILYPNELEYEANQKGSN